MGIAQGVTVQRADNIESRYGSASGGDVNIQWNGTYLESGPATGMWANAPSAINPDPNVYSVFYDDFHSFALGDVTSPWTLDVAATAGTAVLGNASDANTPGNGFVHISTLATDNDFAWVQLHDAATGAGWNFAATGLRTWFEIAFIVDRVTDCSYYVGMFEEGVIKPFADNTGAETVQDGIYWRTLTATPTEIDFCINQDTTETEIDDNADTLATNTQIRLGFYTDGTTLTPYYDGVAGTTTTHAAGNFPTDQSLTPGFGVLSGTTNVCQIFVGYVKIVQMRA